MKKIWFETQKSVSSWRSAQTLLRFWYIGILLVSFSVFSFYARMTGRLFSSNKIDIFNDLQQIAFYFWLIDPELSEQLLTFDDLVQSYLQGDNVLRSKQDEIYQLRSYAKDRKSYLSRVGFSNYEKLFLMLDAAWHMRDEILDLLGKEQTFNYLIPLQNGNEARPNGGFFGSFAFVSLSGGHIEDLQIVDSYLPDYIAPNTRVGLPEWMRDILGGKTIGFIAGNKFGFTDKDGKNLKTLYEKTFHYEYDKARKEQLFEPEVWGKLFQKNIKGIVFLNSELISELLPSFRSRSREWQFVNANIDLIRGEARSHKKELYIKDLQEYLKSNALKLANSLFNNLKTIGDKWYINIYLSNVSEQMQLFLKAYDLTTVYQSDFAYFWNINGSFNKSDGFLHKEIQIINGQGEIVSASENNKLDISHLPKGKYAIKILYTFDVPKTYQDEMLRLQSKYNITMTDREKYILVLQPNPADPTLPIQRWQTREVVYLPSHWQVGEIRGDAYQIKKFNTDFSQGVSYLSKIVDNPHTNEVKIQISIP